MGGAVRSKVAVWRDLNDVLTLNRCAFTISRRMIDHSEPSYHRVLVLYVCNMFVHHLKTVLYVYMYVYLQGVKGVHLARYV